MFNTTNNQKNIHLPVKLNQPIKQLQMDRNSKEINLTKKKKNLTKPIPQVKTEQVLSL